MYTPQILRREYVPVPISFTVEGRRDLVIYYSMFIQADGTLEDECKQQVIDSYLDKLLERPNGFFSVDEKREIAMSRFASLFGLPINLL